MRRVSVACRCCGGINSVGCISTTCNRGPKTHGYVGRPCVLWSMRHSALVHRSIVGNNIAHRIRSICLPHCWAACIVRAASAFVSMLSRAMGMLWFRSKSACGITWIDRWWCCISSIVGSLRLACQAGGQGDGHIELDVWNFHNIHGGSECTARIGGIYNIYTCRLDVVFRPTCERVLSSCSSTLSWRTVLCQPIKCGYIWETLPILLCTHRFQRPLPGIM